MNNKDIKFGTPAHTSILKGATKVADAVGSTIGPKGKVVVVDQPHTVKITKDGVTVSESIKLSDKKENVGARLLQQCARKTVDECGDGTSSTTIIAHSILKNGIKRITAGYDPIQIKEGIDIGTKTIVENLEHQSIPVDNNEMIKQVATISANGDAKIGKLISDAIDQIGIDGVITVNKSKSVNTTVDIVSGMCLEGSTYFSPYFCNCADTLSTNFTDAYILLVQDKIHNMMDLVGVMQQVAQSGRPLLIMCESMEPEPLSTLVMNNIRGTIQVCAVKSPYYGAMRDNTMEDIAKLTGATFITKDLGIKLADVKLDSLGVAGGVKVTRNSTTITSGKGNQDDIDNRIESIRIELDDAKEQSQPQYIINQLTDRLARLTTGICTINVGGITESETNELFDRVEDALGSVKASIKGGVVAGGGIALLRAISNVAVCPQLSTDVQVGFDVICDACRTPFDKILLNAGLQPEVIKSKINDFNDPEIGYDSRNNKYVNMIASGIIDPTLVCKNSLINASSVSGLLLTMNCLITDDDSPVESKPQEQVMM